jgi:hypothetical protein
LGPGAWQPGELLERLARDDRPGLDCGSSRRWRRGASGVAQELRRQGEALEVAYSG